jgi:hypothetical protein
VSVPYCARELQDPNRRLGDVVALDLIVVALDKDAGLTAVGDVISTCKIVVTGQINPNKNQGIRDVVGPDFGALSAREDTDLIGGDGVAFNADIIGLKAQESVLCCSAYSSVVALLGMCRSWFTKGVLATWKTIYQCEADLPILDEWSSTRKLSR